MARTVPTASASTGSKKGRPKLTATADRLKVGITPSLEPKTTPTKPKAKAKSKSPVKKNSAINAPRASKTKKKDGKDRKTKKSKNEGMLDDEVEIPSAVEWNDFKVFKRYKSFRCTAEPDAQSIYTGQYVEVQGIGTKGAKERWVGKIKDIRAKSTEEVFMTLKWFYQGVAQLKEYGISGIPKGGMAPRELVASEDEDIVSVWTVIGIAQVYRLDELDPWQDDITRDEEYFRCEIVQDLRGRKKIKPIQDPKKLASRPYVPLPLGTTPMVYCPRPSCQKWYHFDEVVKIPKPTSKQMDDLASSGLELLELRPTPLKSNARARPTPSHAETGAKVQNSAAATAVMPTPPSSPTHSSSSSVKSPGNGQTAEITISLLDKYARDSITRGLYSIVGNAKVVLEAREVVSHHGQAANKKAREEVETLLAAWKIKYGSLVDEEDEDDEDEEVARYECVGCGGVI